MKPPPIYPTNNAKFSETNGTDREKLLKIKLQSVTIIKSLVVLISILFFLIIYSKNYPVGSANSLLPIPQRGGEDIYNTSCARCHGADGRAQTDKGKRVGATDFTSRNWKISNAKGIRVITNGKGDMPDFKETLTAEEIKSVWAYVRKFKR